MLVQVDPEMAEMLELLEEDFMIKMLKDLVGKVGCMCEQAWAAERAPEGVANSSPSPLLSALPSTFWLVFILHFFF